jgi:thioredoxin reductase
MVERCACGGQAGTSSRIENYLGFPEGISGGDLTGRGFKQATRFGAEDQDGDQFRPSRACWLSPVPLSLIG